MKNWTLNIITKQEKEIMVKNSIIFCAGGLGNPHLLMNLLPSKNENIGKNLSDHAHVNLCKITNNQINKYIDILKPNIKNNLKLLGINKKEEVAQVFEFENFFAGVQLDYKIDPLRKLESILKINNMYLRKFLTFLSFFILKLNGLIAKFRFYLIDIINILLNSIFATSKSPNFVELDKNKLDNFGLSLVIN